MRWARRVKPSGESLRRDGGRLELASRRIARWQVGAIEAGRGVPMVFLHGSADSAVAWKAVLKRMVSEHRVFALDFGSTTPLDGPDGRGRLEADRDLLRSVLTALDEPAHVVAHSYGALLAIRFALDDASRLRSLCLTEPIAFGLLRDESGRHDRDARVGVLDPLGSTLEPGPEAYFEMMRANARAIVGCLAGE